MASLATPPTAANATNPAVKRIMREYSEFLAGYQRRAPDHPLDIVAYPSADNLFDWHFTLRGPAGSPFAAGLYHGRILLPSTYPFKPPDVMLLTPSGRFETGKKVCLSISSFHPANWQPSWSIRTVLTALTAFFPTPAAGAIGSLEYTEAEKAALAAKSGHYRCPTCQKTNDEVMSEFAAMAASGGASTGSGRSTEHNASHICGSDSTSQPSQADTVSSVNQSTAASALSTEAVEPQTSVTVEDVTLHEQSDAIVEPTQAKNTDGLQAMGAGDTSPFGPALPVAATATAQSNRAIPQPDQLATPATVEAGSVTLDTATAAVAPAAPPTATAATAFPAPRVRRAPSKMSEATVILFVLILAILARKLIAHLIANQSNAMISQL